MQLWLETKKIISKENSCTFSIFRISIKNIFCEDRGKIYLRKFQVAGKTISFHLAVDLDGILSKGADSLGLSQDTWRLRRMILAQQCANENEGKEFSWIDGG